MYCGGLAGVIGGGFCFGCRLCAALRGGAWRTFELLAPQRVSRGVLILL